MSDTSQGQGWWQASDGKWYPPEQAAGYAPPPAGYPQPPAGYQPVAGYGYGVAATGGGPLGRPERIGTQILLSIVTLGIYGIYWAWKCHDEMKRHTGDGVGGTVGALIYFFVGIVTLFLLPIEIQRMYERDGRQSPVSAGTAFWFLLFAIPWYVKCQKALNEYWIAKGAPPPD